MIFNKQVTAEKIRKAIDREEAALAKVQASLGEVGTALDAAIGSGKDSEPLYNQLANLELQVRTRSATIARMQAELAAAKAREEREAKRAHLAALQRKVAALGEDLEKKRAKMTEAASALRAAESDFNQVRAQVQEIMISIGLQDVISVLPHASAFTGPAQPLNSPDSNLAAALSRIDSTIDCALRISEEPVADDEAVGL